MLEVPQAVLQWKPLAIQTVEIYKILKPEEILAIVWNESTGNPNAENLSDPSWGLMQITLLIARHYGFVNITKTDLLNPEINMKAGSAFLADLKRKYSKTNPIIDLNCAWVAAYNEGEPNFWKKIPDPNYIHGYLIHLQALGGIPE